MNKLILSHKSALIAIRQNRIDKNPEIVNYINKLLLSTSKHSSSYIEIMVKSKNEAHNNWRFKYKVCTASLPNNSIQKINNAIYCVRPELMLMQLASILPYEQLALISFEMCGTYTIDPCSHNFINNLKAQTSYSEINEYVNKYKKLNSKYKGSKNMQDVLKVLGENSASPMESRLFLKLCGPRNRGFYGCKDLTMNSPVQLSSKAAKVAGQSIVIPDISCVKSKVAIEYNSTMYHENQKQGQKDRRRRDALVYDGWKVFSITPQQLYNEQTFHIIALQILKALGQNNYFKVNNFEEKRHAAFKLLE